MFTSLHLTGLLLAFVSLAPFGSYLPGGSTCVGVGNLWTCVGESASRASSVDISHSGSTHCSCACDGSSPISADCSNTSSIASVQIHTNSGPRPATVVLFVVLTEVGIALIAWQFLNRHRRPSSTLALNDLPSRETGSSAVQRRAELVARARAAESAAGIKILDSDSKHTTRR